MNEEDFLIKLKERLENDLDVLDLYKKYAEVLNITLRRACFIVQKQIRIEMRQSIYDSGIPYQKSWDWFSFDETGLITAPDGKYLAKKIDGKYQIKKL